MKGTIKQFSLIGLSFSVIWLFSFYFWSWFNFFSTKIINIVNADNNISNTSININKIETKNNTNTNVNIDNIKWITNNTLKSLSKQDYIDIYKKFNGKIILYKESICTDCIELNKRLKKDFWLDNSKNQKVKENVFKNKELWYYVKDIYNNKTIKNERYDIVEELNLSIKRSEVPFLLLSKEKDKEKNTESKNNSNNTINNNNITNDDVIVSLINDKDNFYIMWKEGVYNFFKNVFFDWKVINNNNNINSNTNNNPNNNSNNNPNNNSNNNPNNNSNNNNINSDANNTSNINNSSIFSLNRILWVIWWLLSIVLIFYFIEKERIKKSTKRLLIDKEFNDRLEKIKKD